MKIAVDFSVNTASGEAVGFIDGEINCSVEPLINDTICFATNLGGQNIPAGHILGGLLKVVGRTIQPNQEEGFLTLSLEDLTTETRDQALSIIEYLQASYGIFATIYE
jgi:hypothetical protein